MGKGLSTLREVDALGVSTFLVGVLSAAAATRKARRPTLLRAPAYRTPSEASPRPRCGHASWLLWGVGLGLRMG